MADETKNPTGRYLLVKTTLEISDWVPVDKIDSYYDWMTEREHGGPPKTPEDAVAWEMARPVDDAIEEAIDNLAYASGDVDPGTHYNTMPDGSRRGMRFKHRAELVTGTPHNPSVEEDW